MQVPHLYNLNTSYLLWPLLHLLLQDLISWYPKENEEGLWFSLLAILVSRMSRSLMYAMHLQLLPQHLHVSHVSCLVLSWAQALVYAISSLCDAVPSQLGKCAPIIHFQITF